MKYAGDEKVRQPLTLVLVGWLWLLLCPLASGQETSSSSRSPAERGLEYAIDTWTTEDGLPQNSVTAISQTPDGYLWLGTLGGLTRFDGLRFEVFEREITQGLESNRILALYVDREGMLWIGTEGGGLTRYDGSRFATFGQADGLPSSTILSIAEDPDGTLWIGAEGDGLIRFDGSRFTPFTEQKELGSSTIHALHVDQEGMLWIGTEDEGLARFDGDRLSSFTQADGLPSNTVLSIAEDPEGTLWAGTEGGGLAWFDDGQFITPAGQEDFPSLRSIQALAADREGSLWAATFQGLARLRDGDFTFYTTQDGLSRNNVIALYEDQEGSLWVGTDRGLNRLKKTIFDVYTEEDGLADDVAHAVYEDREGSLWIGASCGGLSQLRDEAFTTYDEDDGLSNPCVWSIHEDRQGALWIGTEDGLNRLQNGQFTTYTTADGLADDFVLAIYEDRDGILWVGTRNGLSQLEEDRFTTYTTQDGLAHNWIRNILQDRSGALWVATAGGLSRFENGTFRNYTTQGGLSSEDVRALHEDENGVLWIGTYDGGLNRFEDGQLTTYSTREGLADNRVSVILEGKRGNLWMGGNRGIQRVSKQALNAFAEGRTERVAAVLYGRSDGLRTPECTGGFQPAGWKAEDGRLWFPTVEGVAVVDPAQVSSLSAPPPTVIEQVLVDEEPLAPESEENDRVAPPRGERNIAIRYTSISLLAPERTLFRFRLEGLDDEWTEAGSQRVAYYRNLPPGSYTFQVEASNDGVTWGEAREPLSLYVAPYFYETRWFLALCALGLLAGAFAAHRLNTRRLERRAEELERLVEARTSEVQTEKERTEAALEEAEREREIARNALAVVEEQSVQLLQMDRLKSRFFANLSHEFRTPLTLIIDPLESALRGDFGPLDEAFEHRLQVMHRNARRLLRLISQLLDLAKLEAGSMELRARQQDAIPFLRSLVQVFSPEAERLQITLLFTPVQESLTLYFDRDKLEKIIFNLISNALKATPPGGKVLISARKIASNGTGASHAEISVRDTGIGIPPENIPYIFDRFYQGEGSASRPRTGTGIGLSLVKELVELHRGKIEVESVPGFGSEFTVRLPLGREHLAEHEMAEHEPADQHASVDEYMAEAVDAAPRTVSADEEAKETQETSAEKKSPLVLVVEDNTDMRELIRSHFTPAYSVIEAQNGLEGVRKAREAQPDLIVSDVVMPEMEGIAFCRLLKQDKKLRDIPVILLTARASKESQLEGLRAGADDYLTKPFSAQELLTRAENLIQSRRTLREQFSQEVVIQPSEVVVSSAEAAFLERVRDVVELHLEDSNFTVGALASEVGLSESQLKRRMRAAVDQSPVEFIRNLRLERAAQLLRQRAGNVGDVAFAVGFQNLSYFSKCFRARFDAAPSQYLVQQAEGDEPGAQ